jgi:hypothetical protein
MLILIILLVLVFGGFGGYRTWGPMGGGVSIGTILLIFLILYLCGMLRGGE